MNFSGKKIHMVGIKGAGTAALAEILLGFGAKISGSDTKEEFHTDEALKRLNIKVLPFGPENMSNKIDLVVYSSAYGKDHPERQRASELGVKQRSYAEVLADIFNQKKGIMVAGSHGKTTTTALLGHIMAESGFDPTVLVGGTVVNWGAGARIGHSEWMVVEGDEYQKKFLNFRPLYLLITNIDYDHPDTFPDKISYRDAFEKLKSQTRLKIFEINAGEDFPKLDPGNLLGKHNLLNIGLLLKLTRELGIGDKNVQTSIKSFAGVRRRCEIYFQSEKLIIMDDYAHHPAEIKATLEAVKERYPKYRIKVVFQPHTFSRTQALIYDFASCFGSADEIILLKTYSSARENREQGSEIDEMFYKELAKRHPSATRDTRGIETFDRSKKTIILTMGAGDVWQIARSLRARFRVEV